MKVSPARAGMVPSHGGFQWPMEGFPRASGDGPALIETRTQIGPFPPRERGWSPDIDGTDGNAVVSPARAGMVPRLLR